MSSRASAATSTTLPISVPSLATTVSPVLTAVHATCATSSAIETIIDAGAETASQSGPFGSARNPRQLPELRRLDRCSLSEDEQEEGLAGKPLRVVVHGDGPAAAAHDERRGGVQRECRCPRSCIGHGFRGGPVERLPACAHRVTERLALEQSRAPAGD